MTSSGENPGGGMPTGGMPGGLVPAGRPDSGLSFVPVVWLVFVMAWSVYWLVSVRWLFESSGLPDKVFYFVLGGFAFDIVTIVWGLYLLGLAFSRSARFPRHFTIWQITTIAWRLAEQVYALTVPDFTVSARQLAIAATEIVIGLFCIYLLRRDEAKAFYARPEAEAPSIFVSIVAALLGIILGAVVGAVAGFALGAGIAEVTDVSCFEGGCGYFAVFIGLAGLAVGAIAGGILGVWLVHRRKRQG